MTVQLAAPVPATAHHMLASILLDRRDTCIWFPEANEHIVRFKEADIRGRKLRLSSQRLPQATSRFTAAVRYDSVTQSIRVTALQLPQLGVDFCFSAAGEPATFAALKATLQTAGHWPTDTP